MTQVRARLGESGDEGPAASSRNPYLNLLRTRGAVAFSATAFVARMPMAMYGLGTVLLIVSLTGRYGIAGTVAAAGSVGYALCAPFIAQLADRLGQRRVLLPLTAIFAASTTVFIGCAELHAPFWVLLLTGGLAGASMPSTGSMVRTRWSALLDDDAARLHTAFALESVNDELIFVVGPALGVSAISCFEVSSRQTTGKSGSCGRVYTSSTSSMAATKAALASGGITDCSWR